MAASPDNSFASTVASPPAEPVLITGATGFIGKALALRLAALGGGLRCLVRNRTRAVSAGLPESSLVEGALEDPGSLARAAANARCIVHLAGATRAFTAADFLAANAAGTAALAAAAPNDCRFVLVSSLAAAGPSRDGDGSAAAPDRCHPCSHYGASKLAGERALLAHRERLDWCVIRPPIVYGPADDATRLLIGQALGLLAPVPFRRRPLSLIFVEDLVDLLITAMAKQGGGGFVPAEGAERSDTHGLPRAIAEAAGRAARLLPVPMPLVRCLGPLFDLVQRVRGKPGFLCSDKLREASAPGWVADGAPAQELFGFRARTPIREGFRITLSRAGV